MPVRPIRHRREPLPGMPNYRGCLATVYKYEEPDFFVYCLRKYKYIIVISSQSMLGGKYILLTLI